MDMGGGSDHNGTPAGGMMMHPNSSSSSSMGGGHMMMHMTFFWGHNVDILFSGWPGSRQGPAMYLLALLLVFAASALVDFLSYLPTIITVISRGPGGPTSVGNGLLLTGIAAVRTGLSYLVMLAVMSFNVGVLIAAVLGHALGFFLFGSGVFFRRGRGSQSANGHQYDPPASKC